MALITCKECGQQVSDQATTCPNCGAPINTSGAPQTIPQNAHPQASAQGATYYRPETEKKNTMLYVLLGVLVAVILILIGYFIFVNERNHREEIEKEQAVLAEKAKADSIAQAEAELAKAQAAEAEAKAAEAEAKAKLKAQEAAAEREKAKAENEKAKAERESRIQQAPTRSSGGGSNPYAYLSSTRLTYADLQGMSSYDLCILRNAIYAIHGRYFRRDDLTAFFNQFSWYRPYTWDVKLNSIEQANVQLIKSLE